MYVYVNLGGCIRMWHLIMKLCVHTPKKERKETKLDFVLLPNLKEINLNFTNFS